MACLVAPCPNRVKGRGVCENHLKQWKRGTSSIIGPPRKQTTDLGRLQKYVEVTGFCWLWTGAVGSSGHGRIRPHGRLLQAHRWVYELLVGPIPEGLDLDHLCRIRRCVNPDHLEPVTRQLNLARGAGPGGALR
jgi:hypothetical protein